MGLKQEEKESRGGDMTIREREEILMRNNEKDQNAMECHRIA